MNKDLQNILIGSAKACLVSMEANLPLTPDQITRLKEIYNDLLALQEEVAGFIPSKKSDLHCITDMV